MDAADPLGKTRVDEEETAVSSAEENKAIVRRFEEELARGNLDVIDELASPDFVDRSLLHGQGATREDYKRSSEEFLDAVSIISFTILEQIAEGDTVVTKYRQSGVGGGVVFAGVPLGEEEVTQEGVHIHRISGGKITEEWSTLELSAVWEDLAQEVGLRVRVEQELRVARSIQQASLPKVVPELKGWQISPFYQPAREVGGDFYDFFDLEEGRVGVAVGDATGKGTPAALAVSATSSMLRAVAQALGSSSPGEVLSQVNETLVARIPANMFVTCFYAILDPESGRLLYANANRRRG